jgi:broad specificity phosphatase PhoE
LYDVYERCLTFLLDLEKSSPGGDVAVVAHDASIRMLCTIAAGAGLSGLEWQPLPVASVQRVVLPLRRFHAAS